MSESVRRPTAELGALAASALGVLHGFVFYGSAGRDDSHITFIVARALASHGRLENVNGEAVEQGSSLLHVLLLALLHALSGLPLPTLGVVFSAVLGGVAAFCAYRVAQGLELPHPILAPLFLSSFPYAVYWSVGGLETSLLGTIVVCLVGALAWALRGGSVLPACGAAVAFVLVRPEAPFVAFAMLAAVAALLWISGLGAARMRVLGVVGLATLAAFALVTAFRLAVFDQAFPQTVYAKSAGVTRLGVLAGLDYLANAWLQRVSLDLVTALAAIGLLFVLLPRALPASFGRPSEAIRLGTIVCAGFVAAQTAFVVAAGGDWMEGGRFLVPLLAPLAIAALAGLAVLPRHVGRWVLVLFLLALPIDFVRFQRVSKGTPFWSRDAIAGPVLEHFDVGHERFSPFELWNRVHLRDVPMVVSLDAVVEQLAAGRDRPLTIFSMQMGMVPFHVGDTHARRVRFVDIASLATRDFTDCPVTARARRSAFGAVVSYGDFFERESEIARRCGIERPDVIFDLGRNLWGDPQLQVERAGYVVVFSASGNLPGDGLGLVNGRQFIAVRPELAGELTLPIPAYHFQE